MAWTRCSLSSVSTSSCYFCHFFSSLTADSAFVPLQVEFSTFDHSHTKGLCQEKRLYSLKVKKAKSLEKFELNFSKTFRKLCGAWPTNANLIPKYGKATCFLPPFLPVTNRNLRLDWLFS